MANSIKDMLRGHGQLLRILGVAFGISIAIGNMIGAGVLRAPAAIAGTVPDPVIIIGLWVLGGLHAALGINILAEMGTAIPQSGGMYLYARRALGDVAGLVVGWSDLLSKFAGIAATSIAFAEFLPIVVPEAAAFKTAVAIVVQILLYAVNAFGLREGRAVQEISSLVKTLLLLVFIGAAIAVAAPHTILLQRIRLQRLGLGNAYWRLCADQGRVFRLSAPVYFTEENQTPGSSIPRALGIGLLVTTRFYVGVNAGLIYALGVEAWRHRRCRSTWFWTGSAAASPALSLPLAP